MTGSSVTESSRVVLALEGVSKRYEAQTDVIQHASMTVRARESVALTGPSGCGKSTLLNILGLMDKPSSGRYEINGETVIFSCPQQVNRLRRERIGFIFQNYCLIEHMTVLDNVALPLLYKDICRSNAYEQAHEALIKVGIPEKCRAQPNTLSGGQQQRVGIARALVSRPAVLLADEPTGNLDPVTAHDVFDLLLSIATEHNAAVVVVTHDLQIAARCDSRYRFVSKVLNAFD